MNALFDEPNNTVVSYSSEAVIPVPAYEGMVIHHEILALKKLQEVIADIGGTVQGEDVYV